MLTAMESYGLFSTSYRRSISKSVLWVKDGTCAQLEVSGRVEVIIPVDNLHDWYTALLYIAPIFDGSGMKTKVAVP